MANTHDELRRHLPTFSSVFSIILTKTIRCSYRKHFTWSLVAASLCAGEKSTRSSWSISYFEAPTSSAKSFTD